MIVNPENKHWINDAADAVLVFRKHKLFLYSSQALGWLLIVGVIIGLAFVPSSIFGFLGARQIAILVVGGLVLFALTVLMINWLIWYLSVGVVTREHIIDVDQRGLFNHEVTSIPMLKVEDITVRVKGMLHHMLRIGDVHVQSAGELPNFEFTGVKNPNEITEKILSIQEQTLGAIAPDKGDLTKLDA